jgi:hypothetical protein
VVRLPPAIVDLELEIERIKMMVYGDAGSGKTVFAASAPNCLILSTEPGGTVSAAIQGRKAKVWPIRVWTDLEEALAWLQDNPEVFDWVVLDTVTEMQTKLIYHLLKLVVEDNENRNPDIPAMPDHQEWQNKYKRFFDTFMDLPVNVLFTAHAMTMEDQDGEEKLWPQVQGGDNWKKIARSLVAKPQLVGYIRTVEKKDAKGKEVGDVRRIRWRPSKTVNAKDRFDVMGIYTDDIDMEEVVRRIETRVAVGSASPPATPARRSRRRAAATTDKD